MRETMKANGSSLPRERKKTRETPLPRSAYALLFLLAAALITLGALNGGLRDVLVKAVRICTKFILY